jgi:hypothetical protein
VAHEVGSVEAACAFYEKSIGLAASLGELGLTDAKPFQDVIASCMRLADSREEAGDVALERLTIPS